MYDLEVAVSKWISDKEDAVLKDIKEGFIGLSKDEKYCMALGVTYLASMLGRKIEEDKLKDFMP